MWNCTTITKSYSWLNIVKIELVYEPHKKVVCLHINYDLLRIWFQRYFLPSLFIHHNDKGIQSTLQLIRCQIWQLKQFLLVWSCHPSDWELCFKRFREKKVEKHKKFCFFRSGSSQQILIIDNQQTRVKTLQPKN